MDDLGRIRSTVEELRRLSAHDADEDTREMPVRDLVAVVLETLAVGVPDASFDRLHVIGEELILRTKPAAFQQILVILMENTLLYGSDGAGRIRASLSFRLEAGETAVVYRDEGPGIPPEKREALFEPYLAMGTTGRGRGMGLSIARHIVAYQLSGEITYRPEDNSFLIKTT